MARLRGRAAVATGREQRALLEALTANLYAHEHDFTEEELRAGWELYGEQVIGERVAVVRRPGRWGGGGSWPARSGRGAAGGRRITASRRSGWRSSGS